MSWDLFVQDFPDVATVEAIPDDFEPKSIGPRAELIAKIQEAIPSSDFSDPSWGLIEQDGWSIEVNIGEEEECDSLALHVRGGGPGAIDAVSKILATTGLRGMDAQTGEFFDPVSAQDSFADWQTYRDQIVTDNRPPPKRGFFARLFGG